MTAMLVILLLCALFIAGTEWIRACGEQDRADRAEMFAEECLDMLADLPAGRIVTRTAASAAAELDAEWSS